MIPFPSSAFITKHVFHLHFLVVWLVFLFVLFLMMKESKEKWCDPIFVPHSFIRLSLIIIGMTWELVVSFVLLGLIYNGKIMKREIRPSKQREHNSNKEGKEVKKNKAQTTKKRALLNFTYLLCLCSLCFSLFFTTHLSLHSFHSFSRVFLFNWNENKRSERRERSACFFQLNETTQRERMEWVWVEWRGMNGQMLCFV